MLEFKIRKLDNFKFSYDELVAYYNELNTNYQHLKCTSPIAPDGHSWAMQTKLPDPTVPCPPYHMPGDNQPGYNNNFDTPTPLMFGFAKKILDAFPRVKQTVITVHYPGALIPFHVDNEIWLGEEHLKIHLPIETNNDSYFQFEGEEFNMQAGSAYLANTAIPHGTHNRGTTNRAHLIFKVPVSDVEELLTKEFVL